ncbi:MAG: peroxide stress protein YaaA [Pseudomonadota bacterium]
MLFVLSPAKSLDESPLTRNIKSTKPAFMGRAAELVSIMRKHSPQQIASLMKLSDKLASLNSARYEAWSDKNTAKNSKPAILMFNGDVYDGLDAKQLDDASLAWAQEHICILSGLYGVLRPLDALQAYRLEMGTALSNPVGKDLYQFWGSDIAQHLNKRLRDTGGDVLVNLASEEYFKSVDLKAFKGRIVQCVFEDEKASKYKIISFFAKRARGLMARWAIEHRVTQVEQLRQFNAQGYVYAPSVSSEDKLVFRRKEAAQS